MFSTASTVYTAKCQSRALAAVVGDTSRHRFMVGTCSVRELNEIVVVDFDEENNSMSCVGTMVHAGEVSTLCPSPFDVTVVATHGRYRDGEPTTTIWTCGDMRDWGSAADGEDDDDDDGRWASERSAELSQRATLPTVGACASIVWCPKEHGEQEALATLDSRGAMVFERDEATQSVEILDGNAMAWSPHAADELAIATDTELTLIDRRAAVCSSKIERPHDGRALDVDYNPNKPFCLATAGDDGMIKFWDVRAGKSKSPLKILTAAHNEHWITSVKYNRFHDQLIASAGTDRTVNLWRVSSISSAPLLESRESDLHADDDLSPRAAASDKDDDETLAPDLKVKTYDLHDDSVYGLAWSACDAWVFAGLSYDGRLVLNHVPSPEKYKILL